MSFEATDIYEKKGWKYKCMSCFGRAKWLIKFSKDDGKTISTLVFCHKCTEQLKSLLLQITRWP